MVTISPAYLLIHEISDLIASLSIEGSGRSMHMHRLTRVFAVFSPPEPKAQSEVL